MVKYAEYRKRAREAQTLADLSTNPDDKAAWLKIAQGWLQLLPKPRQWGERRFDAEARARSTGQGDSEASR